MELLNPGDKLYRCVQNHRTLRYEIREYAVRDICYDLYPQHDTERGTRCVVDASEIGGHYHATPQDAVNAAIAYAERVKQSLTDEVTALLASATEEP